MDNLKYPKVSYLHNTASSEVFDLLGTDKNHAWKKDGHIIKKEHLKYISLTHDGSSTGMYGVIEGDFACITDCKFEIGFAVKRKYRHPGRGNAYPDNHPYSRPYFTQINEDQLTAGVLSDVAKRAAEKDLLAQMARDHASLLEADFFTAHKVAYIGAGADVKVTDAAGVETTVTLAEGIANGILTVKVGTKWVMMGIADGFYFGVADGAASVESQGIAILGKDAAIHFDVHSISGFKFSPYSYAKIVFPASGSISANVFFKTADAIHADGAVAAFKTAITANDLTAAYVDSKTLHVIGNKDMFVDIAVMPVLKAGGPAVQPVSVTIAAGPGRYPINTAFDLEGRFLGRYQGMEGMRQTLPNLGERYVILQYVIGGKSSALSSGASSKEEFETRVDIVLSSSAVLENVELMKIVKTASL